MKKKVFFAASLIFPKPASLLAVGILYGINAKNNDYEKDSFITCAGSDGGTVFLG